MNEQESENIESKLPDRKLTARIDNKMYGTVKEHFHHGQQTQFFQQVFESLVQLIKEGNASEITDYLYNNKPLTLPAKGE